MNCRSCSREVSADFAVCPYCATPLAAPEPRREERKVVTVLFCDVVGFTQRAEALDPEDVSQILAFYHERVRRELERFGGTVEKFIGDAVMALFGAPTAHEDDPERAVRAALGIREWASGEDDLQIRIGITTGEALVKLSARPERGEGMASGDVVNTAARLQAAAPENAILVDENTRRATERAIDYREPEPIVAKGKAEPVRVWEALDARSRAEVEREAAAPLVGRARELELLRNTLDRVREERSTQLVTLIGVPGIGKSRLVYELYGAIERGDLGEDLVFWRRGRSLPYGDGVTFWAVAEIVKAQAGILETDSADAARTKLADAVRALIRDEHDAAWVESNLLALVGVAGAAGDEREEAFAAWRRFFEAMAEQRPLILVFEDLHWADEGLLDFVDHLAEWTSGVPMLLLCTARPELLSKRPGWGGGKPNAITISVAPLSDDETAHLVHGLLDRPALPAELQSVLLANAAGNPLYAEEFARMVAERAEAAALELSPPDSVQAVIAARLDVLPLEEKKLLQDAAVVGRVFWPGAVERLDGHARGTLDQALHVLERKEFVRRERRTSVEGQSEYAFRHLLVRDVAYAQIPRAARAEKHRLAAEWIESLSRAEDHAEMLAYHYGSALELARAAGRDTTELGGRARLAFRDAGDRAMALYAFPVAVRHYERALELWPADDGERPQLLLRYGEALASAHAREAEEILAEARDLLLARGDVEGAARAEGALGELLYDTREGLRGSQHLEHAVSLLRDRPPSEAKAEALVRAARFRVWSSRPGEALAPLREALAISDELGLEQLRVRALHNLGNARMLLGDLEGIEDVERSFELVTDPLERLRIYNNLSGWHGHLGNVARERELVEEGLREAERLGIASWVSVLRYHGAFDLFATGRWDDALAGFDPPPPEFRALIALGRGDAGTAVDAAAGEAEEARVTGRPDNVAAALGLYAWSLHAAGRGDDARVAADELEELLPRALPGLVYFASVLAFALDAVGRGGVLLAALDGVPPSPWFDAARLYAAGELERAADAYAKLEDGFSEAFSRLRAGEQLVSEGRQAEADAQLRRAAEFFRRAGATAFLARAERSMAATA